MRLKETEREREKKCRKIETNCKQKQKQHHKIRAIKKVSRIDSFIGLYIVSVFAFMERKLIHTYPKHGD